jgi:AraC-like DNA-binding protein
VRTAETAELFAAAADMEERVAIAERILLDHLARTPADGHRIVAGATQVMDRTGGTIAIAEIERVVGVSRRQLERVFAEQVGVTPKMYCRVARLQRMLPLIGRSGEGVDWSDLVYRCGYYDQSHLIAEIRALTGLTPTELHRERVAFFQSPHEPAR